MNSLKGKKALVTGGASGIGRAITLELAGLGAEVCVHYRSSREQAEETVDTINANGGRSFAVQADLTIEEDVKALFRRLTDEFGGLDVLVNNAGDLVERYELRSMSIEFFRTVMAVNMDSMMMVTRESSALLAKSGSSAIVNVASLAGRKGGHGGSLAYATAKGAVLTFTRALSSELAPDGIRVNAVAPGLILGSKFHEVHTTEESKRRTVAGIPLGRAGTCEDVARAVGFLASEYNGFITGATLDINGGVYMA